MASRMASGVVTFLILHFLIYGSIRWLAGGFARVVELQGIQQTKLLQDGDAVVCPGRFLERGGLHRGDIVLYAMPETYFGHGFSHEGIGIDRILGLPGDRVRIERARTLVNGAEVTPTEGPLRFPDGWPDGVELMAGPGEYIVVPSLFPLTVHGDPDVAGFVSGLSHVPADRIMGKAVWRIRPLGRMGSLRNEK